MSSEGYDDVYRDHPELYELLYQRYLRSVPTFVDLVRRETPPGGSILDAAAGTGSVTIPLLQAGYDVTSLDAAPGMLAVLRRKADAAGAPSRIIVSPIEELETEARYATICMRQAVNYLDLETGRLALAARRIRDLLAPSGSFIFNAPNVRSFSRTYPDIESRYEEGGRKAYVLERNTVDGSMLTHQQDSLVWDDGTVRHIREMNAFRLYTRGVFHAVFRDAGFVGMKFLSSSLGPYRQNDPTLYGVAQT